MDNKHDVLLIRCIVLGDLMTNCYVLTCPGRDETICWIVDVGMHPEPLIEYLEQSNLSPGRILLTHGHADHIAGVGDLKQRYPRAILTVPHAEAAMLSDPLMNMSLPFGLHITAPPPDETIQPGDELNLAGLIWKVLDVSGHTPGAVAYYCSSTEIDNPNKNNSTGVVFTGDALFAGSIGRTDIPGGDHQRLVKNIHENLLSLPDSTRVLPGHGPETTIGAERRLNPFLTR